MVRVTRARLRWIVPSVCWLATAIFIVLGVISDVDDTLRTVAALGGSIAGVLGFVFTLDAFGRLQGGGWLSPRRPAEDRVKQLVAALSESTKVIAEIEREVRARGALAERLQADVKRHRELLDLNRDEVEAVAQTLRQEVRREGSRSFWVGVLVNAVFFGLGVAVTLLLGT